MDDRPAWTVRRRHLLDGGFAVLLLAIAVLNGYAVLAPSLLGLDALTAAIAPRDTLDVMVEHPDAPEEATVALAVPPRARAAVRRVALVEPAEPWATVVPRRELPMRPEVDPMPVEPVKVTGGVSDPSGQPLAGVSVVANGVEEHTDASGRFAVNVPAAGMPVIVKLPGYEKLTVSASPEPLDLVLRPHVVKAVYLTYYGVADRGIRARVFELLTRTEVNAIVIDIKGDRGWIPYRTEVAAALEAGAQGPVMLRDVEGMLAYLKMSGVYTIARIVTFKDNVLARARPDLAIIDERTGQPWIDNEKLAWVDPFREEVWAYNLAIAKEAVRKGFDEVQFDYVRFPTDGRLGAARYAQPNNRANRVRAVAGFLGRARRELGAMGAFVAADIFGYTAFNDNDTQIGQRIEDLAPHVDYLCPMVYPSGYTFGIPGYRNPVAAPYHVVFESIRLIRERAAHTRMRVRPWLQDFRDYAFDRRAFGVAEIRAQMRGAGEGGAVGWMLWNSRNDYTIEALEPKGTLAAR